MPREKIPPSTAISRSILFASFLLPIAPSLTASHDYAIDADLSFLRQAEERGTKFKDHGIAKPGLQIFHDHGCNQIRLRLQNRDNFADLLKAGISGVDAGRADAPRPRLMIHIEKSGDRARTQWFFDNLLRRGVEFDVIGQSCYPWWHGSLLGLRDTPNFMAGTQHKDIILVEVAYNWRPTEYKTRPAPFPKTPDGQREFLAEVNRLVLAIVLAIPHGPGKGIFWWEPALPPGTPIARRGMLDADGNALPAIAVFHRCTRGTIAQPGDAP